MNREMRNIVASKRAMRRELAALPIAEKLRLLDPLRERSMTLATARQRILKTAKK